MENPETNEIRSKVPVDRVVLGEDEAKLLTEWALQFNQRANGLIKVTKADLANYIISSFGGTLIEKHFNSISLRFYDEARWLSWALGQIKEAKKLKTNVAFDDLVKFRDLLMGKKAKGESVKALSGPRESHVGDGTETT